MSSKLYLLRLSPEYLPAAYQGTWNSNNGTGSNGNIFIDTTKYGDTGSTLAAGSANTTATPWKHAHTRGVSRRLLPQTISGTVDVVIGVDQGNANNMDYWKLHIYVINETSGAVHGTLLNNYEETLAGGATEFAVTTNTAKTLKTPATLTSVTIPTDANKYRLVVEIGYISNQVSPIITNARIRRGVQGSDFVSFPDLVVGSITTQDEAGFIQFSGDLLFDAAIPPINKNFQDAITIASLPYSQNIDPISGYPTQVWYKFSPTFDTVLSILCCNTAGDTTLSVYTGIGGPPVTYASEVNGPKPQLYPVKVGVDLWFSIYVNTYVSGQTFLLSLIAAPTDPIQVGDLIISEDMGGGGTNIYDPTLLGLYPYTWFTDTGVIRYVTAKIPATELGCCLTNGKWGIIEHNGARIFIYDMAPGLTEIGRFALTGPKIRTMGTDFTYFYVTTASDVSASPASVYKVTDTGVVTGPIATGLITNSSIAAGSGGNSSSGISRDGSIIYYPETIAGGQVQRHNLVTNIAMSSFTTPDVTMIPGDVIVLLDGTIVVIFYTGTLGKLVHYSATGTILHTKDFEAFPWRLHHIVWEAHDNSDMVWCWDQDVNTLKLNRFRLYQFSTNLFIKEFTKSIFFDGQGAAGTACVPPDRFGAPESCPLMVVMKVDVTTPPPPDVSGIYYINPIKATRHDSYYDKRTPPGPSTDVEKKIPNPTIKTALIGE